VFGFGIGVNQNPEMAGSSDWMRLFLTIPEWGWILAFLLMVALMFLLQFINYVFQAASIRITVDVREDRQASIRRALNLGANRWAGITRMMLTLGLALVAVSSIPMLVGALVARTSPWGITAMQLTQVIGLPISLILGVSLLVVLLAIAIEELPLGDAIRRAGTVLRNGWWCFLLSYMVILGLSFGVALLIAPVFLAGFILALFAASAAPFVLAGMCLIAAPIGLVLMAFINVLWTVMLTLTYQAVQKTLPPPAKPKAS
jgi:hypothetical protein